MRQRDKLSSLFHAICSHPKNVVMSRRPCKRTLPLGRPGRPRPRRASPCRAPPCVAVVGTYLVLV